MEYIEIMSTTEIFEKILFLVDKLSNRTNVNFEISNSNGVCRIEYSKNIYSFFYEIKDNKLRISIVEVSNEMPGYFGEDLNAPKFRKILNGIFEYLDREAAK